MKTIIACALVILSAAHFAYAQDVVENKLENKVAGAADGLATKEETRAICEAYLQKMLTGDVAGAFGLVKPIFPLPENEMSMLQMQALQQLGMIEQRFGNAIGYEFIEEKNIKDLLIEYRYVEKFDNHAMRWVFVFYRPKDLWYINKITWDDQITQLFD